MRPICEEKKKMIYLDDQDSERNPFKDFYGTFCDHVSKIEELPEFLKSGSGLTLQVLVELIYKTKKGHDVRINVKFKTWDILRMKYCSKRNAFIDNKYRIPISYIGYLQTHYDLVNRKKGHSIASFGESVSSNPRCFLTGIGLQLRVFDSKRNQKHLFVVDMFNFVDKGGPHKLTVVRWKNGKPTYIKNYEDVY